jgi:hypothetical protein
MRKFNLTKIIVPLVLALAYTSNASANWYAWYQQGSYYGVWATIQAPSTAPSTPTGAGQAHSVTIPGPHWIRAGWYYFSGDTTPQKYWEYCAENCENDPAQYKLQPLGSQAWGSGVKNEVSHDSSMGQKTWCAWVGGVRKVCKENIQTAPTTVIIQSEVHASPQTQINTEYRSIRIRNSSGVWVYADLNNLFSDFPYKAVKQSSERFRTYRIVTKDIFLPIVVK